MFETLLAVLPPELVEVLASARASGLRVWLVGGTVRDALLGRVPLDLDLASESSPSDFAARLPDSATHLVQTTLGACSFRLGDREVVHTTFRIESDYGPDRRPRDVRFVCDPVLDAQRRDFTVNAIYVDVLGRSILDPTDGSHDLAVRRLRTIGDPRRRFAEDPLRILRGVRFEADLGLDPAIATSAAMAEFAPKVGGLVVGRQYDELRGIVAAADWRRGVCRLIDLGAFDVLLPELAGEASDVRTRVGSVGTAADVPARWIALFGDAERAVAALTRLTAPRRDRRAISIRS
ncbi:MAG: hypothetical protein AB7I19_01455 [Planctomycetota bacterium]